MRDHTTPIFKELTASGVESIALTPGAAQQTGTFNISGVPPVSGDMRNYATNFWGHTTTVFDPDAAGNAVNWDKLYKIMASWRLFSPIMGEVFPHQQTRGSVLGHIVQVFAGGFRYPQPARTQLPASTDSDVTLDLFYCLPLSYECLIKPHETAQWVGFFDQGLLEGILDVSTVLDGDYAGAVIKATTALRSYVEMLPSSDTFLGVPVQWRERQITGGGTQPTLKGVGQETQLTGVEQGCGLAALLWLTDATGIGLSGPDGVDNFTQIEVPWRSQPLLKNLDPLFLVLHRATQHRVGPVAGTGTTIVADGSGWPSTMAVTTGVDNRPAADSQKLFLPIIFPGADFETSKAQRVRGDLVVNFNVTSAITNPHRFLSFELMEFDENQRARMWRAMGVDMNFHTEHRKAARKNSPAEGKLRYTRICARPRVAAA